MIKKALIKTDSPLYLKRMASELRNHSVNGFWANDGSIRCNGARVHKGVLQVWSIGHKGWMNPNTTAFIDSNGHYIGVDMSAPE